MTDRLTCCLCGEDFPAETDAIVSGIHVCPNCLPEHTLVCQDCGERILADENAGTDSHVLCQSCYDNHYTTCNRCGALIRFGSACYMDSDEDEEYPFCGRCYASHETSAIRDYYYKPTPIFYGDSPRYFGVELEIDEAGESPSNARDLLNLATANGSELIYCKHDGSLNNGFEIVTHPMSLDFHLQEMPWKVIMNEAVQMGYRSHQANTCGLHVHVNRTAFGHTEEEQDGAIARILYFFEKYWEELLKFSRHTQSVSWSAGQPAMGTRRGPRISSSNHAGRYTCVNLTNYDTIEFRIFRGTLKYKTLIATLQMIDRICDAAFFLTDEELKSMSWTTFVSGCVEPELVQYLKERQMYVNEPIESEVEL